MRGGVLPCTLEVRGGVGDCTRKTFSIDGVPHTLREVVNLLKAQDLRLQNGVFDISVSHGDSSTLQKLLTDKDVKKFFSLSPPDRLFFKVLLGERAGALSSSILADSGLVHLRIHHLSDDLVTEKRFIPPRRGVLEALKMAVRDAIQHPPPASMPVQLYTFASDERERRPLDDEGGVNSFLRSCLAARSPCSLTYRFDDKSIAGPAAMPKPRNHNDKSITSQPDSIEVNKPTSERLGGDNKDGSHPQNNHAGEKSVSPEPMDDAGEKPVSSEPMDDAGEKPVSSEPVDDAGEKPVSPEPVDDAGEKPVSPEAMKQLCKKRISCEPCGDAEIEGVVSETVVPLQKDKSASKSVAPMSLSQSDANNVLLEDDYCAVEKSSPLCQKPSGKCGVSNGGDPVVKDDSLVPLAQHRASSYELPKLTKLLDEEEVRVVTSSGGGGAEDVTVANDVFQIEIECAFIYSTVVFPFSWRRDSVDVFQSLRAACLLALEISLGDDGDLYDRNGCPLRTEEQACELLEKALKSGHTRVSIVVWMGHPCTTGLPLQCFVSWGTQELVLVCAVEPKNALADLQRAILEEYGVDLKAENNLKVSLKDAETAEELELTESCAYVKLKSAARDAEVVNIVVSSSYQGLPRCHLQRAISSTAAMFVGEVVNVLGDSFHSRDVLHIFEDCREKSKGSFDGEAKDFLELMGLMLSDPHTLTSEKLLSCIEKTATSCSEEGTCDILGRCIVIAQMRAACRPFEVLKRFFRRLYKSIQIPEGAHGIPLAMVARQLAQAGLRDAKGLLRRDRTILAELQEKDYTELFLRLYYSDSKVVSRAAVAARLSGISSIKSRRLVTRREQELLQRDYLQEVRHAFDGVRSTDMSKFFQNQGLEKEPHVDALLSVVGYLLAPHPVQSPNRWLVEHFKGKMGDVLDAKLRTFEDSVVSTPMLYHLCWDVLKPELNHLSFLPESHVASALAYWAFFAVQLVCANRHLEFPPVPLVDLHGFSPVGSPILPAAIEGNGVVGVVSSSPTAAVGGGGGEGATAASPMCPKKKSKIKYKYSYLCHDLRRDPRLPHPAK